MTVFTIDAHAGGEPCRVVYAGFPGLPGGTMGERRRAFRERWDRVRCGLTLEPRGHSGMFGAVMTAPARAGSRYGLIFFDPVGYLDGCGHATLCSVAVWRRLWGPPELPLTIDNPDDTVTVVRELDGDDDRCRVTVLLPPVRLVAGASGGPGVEGLGDGVLAECGNRFVLIPAAAAGLTDLRAASAARLRRAAERVRSAWGAPAAEEGCALQVLFFEEARGNIVPTYRTAVVFNGTQIDRSPCGTGSATLAAALLARGALRPGALVRTVGPAGEAFELLVAPSDREPGGFDVELSGCAYITGVHQWVFSESDRLAWGYRFE